MTNEELASERREKVALFRYGLIADLVHLDPHTKGLYDKLKEKAQRSYTIPGSRRTYVAPETMRGWLRTLRKGGFDALRPKPRADQGQARAIPQPAADLLCSIKEDHPALSVQLVIAQARSAGGLGQEMQLAPATVHRLLSQKGLMAKRPDQPTSNDRRRFAFEKAGELWMSDVLHGPSVAVDDRRKHKSYLIAFIDDATRVIPYCAFALSENTATFLPVLEQAIRRRGLCKRLYVDNGAVYRSHHLELVCAKLGITLIHSRPYVPQGRGKVERFFRTVRMQLLPVLTAEDTRSLEALNRRLWGWVEGEYHQSPHKGIDGQTPLERWALSADEVKMPEPGLDLADLFLFEEKRKVQKDRTVSLHGVIYEVDALFVGQTVTLRFDPTQIGRAIQVWFKGKQVQTARRVDVYGNCFVKRDHATKLLKPEGVSEQPPLGLRLRDFDEGNDPKGGY